MPACQADKPVKYQLCDKHDGEGMDRYCFDHGIITCGICFTREHKSCQAKKVSEACMSFNMSAEKTSFSDNIGLLLKHVKETSQLVKSNKVMLEDKKQGILTEAQNQRDKLLEQINKSYQTFNGEVTSMFKDHHTTLSARQSAIDQIENEVETILQSLQESCTKKQNEQKEFLELQYAAEKVRLCEDKIRLLNLKHIDIDCILNTNIQPLFLTKNKFGEVSSQTAAFHYSTEFHSIHYPYTGPRQDPHRTVPETGAMEGQAVQYEKLTPLDKVNVKIPDDKHNCGISGIDITIDGNMLLMDRDNCKVKLFSPDGILLSSLRAPEKPRNVAVINKSEAAFSMAKQIGIIDIADSTRLSLKRTIKTKQYFWGITTYNNNLIVICEPSTKSPRSVHMIDIGGNVLWTRTIDSAGKILFDGAWFLTRCPSDDDDTVIVTDDKKQTITVLDAGTGKVVKECEVRGNEPCGVTADGDGNVYVCYGSGEITVWSRGMQDERQLIAKSKHLMLPWAMAYDSRRSELVLTSVSADTDYRNFIHRFKIS